MSFRDEFLKARLGSLPVHPPSAEDDDEEEEELDSFDVNAVPGLAGRAHAAAAGSSSGAFLQPRGPKRAGRSSNVDYTPLSGASYFEQALQVSPSSSSSADSFRVYYTPPRATSLQSEDDEDDDSSPVVFVCHHGAGYAAMSFALLAKELVDGSKGKAGVLAIDARGHGKTKCEDENDLSLERLSSDLVSVLREVFPPSTTKHPSLVLVGHSMGGSVVVRACPAIQSELKMGVVGVVNLDVVEGTAMEFLGNMMDIIQGRPKGFESLEKAIEWHVRTKTIANPASARVSVPSLFNENPSPSSNDLPSYIWRSDLASTEPYWAGWFRSLSSSFLSLRAAKLLVLAGAESLDKDLMVGQMQGKYQLSVFTDVGHCLQEDAPKRLAGLLLEFWRRNDTSDVLKGVKKVGQK